MTDRPYRITVVCLGNICRSPIGEAVLRDRVERAGLAHQVEVDSAGTGDWHLGYPADSRAQAALHAAGYSLDHISRQIDHTWFADIDLVLAMDASNYRALQSMIEASGADVELRMMRSFDPALAHLVPPHPDLEVDDPYYGGDDGFADALRLIEAAVDGLVAALPARIRA